MTTMIEVEPQPRIDTLVRSGQTGAIVDAAATFTESRCTSMATRPAGRRGLRVVALTPLDAVR